MRLEALSVGIETPTRHFSGLIHSLFHHACNVRLHSDALLTLVSSEKGNPCQGIRLRTPLTFTFLNRLRVGQAVACRGGILRVSGADLSVDLRTARLWHIDLKGLQVDLHQRGTAQAWAVAWQELVKHRRENGRDTLIERIVRTVPALLDATRNLQVDTVITAFRPLIGLGAGLTPSGDDFIVGYLAGLWSTAGHDSSRLRFLSSLGAWLSHAAAGTNAISYAYITSAINGNVSEPIATLAQILGQARRRNCVREATLTALQVGNTSGADGVLGLLLGCIPWAAPSFQAHLRDHATGFPHLPSPRAC